MIRRPVGGAEVEPRRDEVDGWTGDTLLEFGASWCPICQAARPHVDGVVASYGVRHVRVEDGRGKPLGRSFRVKLWPTLILMRDGAEVGRTVRPQGPEPISALLQT